MIFRHLWGRKTYVLFFSHTLGVPKRYTAQKLWVLVWCVCVRGVFGVCTCFGSLV